MDVEILSLGPGDADVLANFDPEVFDYEITPKLLGAYLAAPGHRLVVARADQKVIGQARGIIHYQPDEPPQLYVDNLGVSEDWRRQGIAGRLLAALDDWARDLGCVESWVLTETDNAAARALYASRGADEDTSAYFTRSLRG